MTQSKSRSIGRAAQVERYPVSVTILRPSGPLFTITRPDDKALPRGSESVTPIADDNNKQHVSCCSTKVSLVPLSSGGHG